MGLELTRGGEYAVRAMACLARRREGDIVSLGEIGRAEDIPECFLAKILQSLAHAGLVVSRRGACGGFALAGSPAEISLRDIIEAVDGPISLNRCVVWPEECSRSHDCTAHEAWTEAQARLMDVLETVTLASLVAAPAV